MNTQNLRIAVACLLATVGVVVALGCGGGGGGADGVNNYCCSRGDLLCVSNFTGAGICGSNQQICCDSCCAFLCLTNCRCYRFLQSWCAKSVECGCPD